MLWSIWQSLIVCFCSIPFILMTQVRCCLRSHYFSKVHCAYTCMENQGADSESSPFYCKVCNSGSGRKQVKLVLSFSLEVCFPLVQYRYGDWLQQLKVSKSAQRLNMSASWQATCKEFLSVGILLRVREFINTRYVWKPKWVKVFFSLVTFWVTGNSHIYQMYGFDHEMIIFLIL